MRDPGGPIYLTVTPVPPSVRRDPILIVLALLVPAMIGIALADTGGEVVGAIVWPALVLLAGTAAVNGVRIWRDPQATAVERRLWGAAGLAGAIFAVSDAWQFGVYLRDPGSTAAMIGGPVYSAGIVVGTVCLVVALVTLPMGFVTRAERVRFLLDAATVLAFAATVGCYFTVTAGDAGFAGAGRTISLLFGPAIYMVAAFSLIKILMMPVKPFTAAAGTMLSLSAVLEAAATGFRPMLVTHDRISWQQAATVVAVTALAAAPRIQHLQMSAGRTGRPRVSRRPYSLLPYAALLGTFVLLIGALAGTGWQTATWILVAGSAVSSALVVVRQLVAFADNARLLEMLNVKMAESDRLAAELEHLAFHDALTGLANRALFQRHLDAGDGACTVMLLDLDGFKPVNDTYGHAAGDAVLAAVGLRLRAFARPGELVARLGGDEFALLSPHPLSTEEGRSRAAELAVAIGLPMTVLGQEVRVGASVGVATGAGGCSGDDLLHEADLAMYARKADRGRETVPKKARKPPARR
jgi:diguanylate cyclase (GGDEF)-like protein